MKMNVSVLSGQDHKPLIAALGCKEAYNPTER